MKPRRRMLHWLLNALTILSLLLCLASAGLWVRSYWRRQVIVLTTCSMQPSIVHHKYGIEIGGGELCFGATHMSEYAPVKGTIAAYTSEVLYRHHVDWLSRLGFVWRRDGGVSVGRPWHGWTLILPQWLVTAVLTLPVLFLVRERAARAKAARIANGLCAKCGYDLRATPERCPECGTEVVNAKKPRRQEEQFRS